MYGRHHPVEGLPLLPDHGRAFVEKPCEVALIPLALLPQLLQQSLAALKQRSLPVEGTELLDGRAVEAIGRQFSLNAGTHRCRMLLHDQHRGRHLRMDIREPLRHKRHVLSDLGNPLVDRVPNFTCHGRRHERQAVQIFRQIRNGHAFRIRQRRLGGLRGATPATVRGRRVMKFVNARSVEDGKFRFGASRAVYTLFRIREVLVELFESLG